MAQKTISQTKARRVPLQTNLGYQRWEKSKFLFYIHLSYYEKIIISTVVKIQKHEEMWVKRSSSIQIKWSFKLHQITARKISLNISNTKIYQDLTQQKPVICIINNIGKGLQIFVMGTIIETQSVSRKKNCETIKRFRQNPKVSKWFRFVKIVIHCLREQFHAYTYSLTLKN